MLQVTGVVERDRSSATPNEALKTLWVPRGLAELAPPRFLFSTFIWPARETSAAQWKSAHHWLRAHRGTCRFLSVEIRCV